MTTMNRTNKVYEFKYHTKKRNGYNKGKISPEYRLNICAIKIECDKENVNLVNQNILKKGDIVSVRVIDANELLIELWDLGECSIYQKEQIIAIKAYVNSILDPYAPPIK